MSYNRKSVDRKKKNNKFRDDELRIAETYKREKVKFKYEY